MRKLAGTTTIILLTLISACGSDSKGTAATVPPTEATTLATAAVTEPPATEPAATTPPETAPPATEAPTTTAAPATGEVIELAITQTVAVPYGETSAVLSLKFQLTNNTKDDARAYLQLGVKCGDEFSSTYPDFPTLESMDISQGEDLDVAPGTADQGFALPTIVSYTGCENGAEQEVVVKLDSLLEDHPNRTINLPLVSDVDGDDYAILGDADELLDAASA